MISYLTDRESRTGRHSPLPGTVEDTADQVAARGGRAVPLVIDHADDAAIVIAGHLSYDLAMTGVNRLCRTMGHDFAGHGSA